MAKFYPKLYQTQLKVGIFTLVVLSALIVGYLWLTSSLNLKAQQDLRVRFDDVQGLEIGDKIVYRGMEIGRVREVINQQQSILVVGKISRELKLPVGSQFLVTDSSLMGGKVLSIYPGDQQGYLSLSGIQSGGSPAGIMSIVSKASAAVDEVTRLLLDLRKENGLLERTNTLMDNAGKAVDNVDTSISGLKTELSRTILQVDNLTSQLNAAVAANRENLDQAIGSAPQTMNKINHNLDSLQVLSSKLHLAVDSINEGKGSAGKLLTKDELYDKLLKSVSSLDSLITDVKAHPKKYLKFSLF